jgi:hypothetical protein
VTIWRYALLRFLIRNAPAELRRTLRDLARRADRGDHEARAEFYRLMNQRLGEACASKELV